RPKTSRARASRARCRARRPCGSRMRGAAFPAGSRCRRTRRCTAWARGILPRATIALMEPLGGESVRLYRRLLSYVSPYKKAFAIAVLGMMAAAATEPLFPALIKPMLDGGFAAGGPAFPPIFAAGMIIAVFV